MCLVKFMIVGVLDSLCSLHWRSVLKKNVAFSKSLLIHWIIFIHNVAKLGEEFVHHRFEFFETIRSDNWYAVDDNDAFNAIGFLRLLTQQLAK